ncbi:MAG: bacteriohopanetetrol glucosamine biosynthesis glycosyltransferase HpnI [Deltaproteobacteria bacterium]|nr:bacteriohopanetetrol glucosamine biosynthesis glycosyltransferase HpnI [Deltaproteobacteria bacterium]MBI3387618.1 bacteriohopanetetrol glucosamine biosynthesis glycosyltransferase HpnI [Deltaproteobacteria bacterium]
MMLPVLHVSALQAVIGIGVLASIWYYLTVLYSAREFFRWADGQRAGAAAAPQPGVSVLKPLKGLDVNLYENLATFCRQDYRGAFQVVFGVADAGDSAIAVVRQLQRDFSSLDIELVIDPRVYGTNYKVSNLHNMYARARHDVLVIADSDIRVPPDYLCRVVAPLHDPAVGVVSCLYKAVRQGGLPTLVESLFISTDFDTNVMAARKVEKPSYAFGATMALRRETLDAIGGFLAIRNYLADDYYLGYLVAQRGLKLVLSDLVVETVLDVGPWAHLFQHQVRWARTYRTVRPGGYFGSVFTQGTMWAVFTMLYYGFSPTSVAIAATVIGLRLWCASAMCFRYLHTDNTPLHMLLVLPKDLFVSAVWLISFLGNTVRWSGHDFRVLRGGEMVHVTAPATTSAWQQPALAEPTSSAPDSL